MGNFEEQIHNMFDHIWDCKVDHPVFNDTVGDLMKAVIQCHNKIQSSEKCNSCKHKLKLIKYDYSQGGCQHSDYDGYACMAFANNGRVVHMVGINPETGYCECWTPRERGY